MAIYTNFYGAGETDTNVFDSNLLSSLLRTVPQGAYLSAEKDAMVYDLLLDTAKSSNSFSFGSTTGFSAAWTGMIDSISLMIGGTKLSGASGLSANAADVKSAINEGDTDTLNALFWNGADKMTGGASDDTLRGFGGYDVLTGGRGNDSLIGDLGNDKLNGGIGDDNLFGGQGNDRLQGGSGNDVLVGGGGEDLITGGAGRDSLTGGLRADTFRFSNLDHLIGIGEEIITDFTHSQGDKIDMRLIDANIELEGDQAFRFLDFTVTDDKPQVGDLIITTVKFMGEGDPANLYGVELYTGAEGYYNFVVRAVDGLLTADDFIL